MNMFVSGMQSNVVCCPQRSFCVRAHIAGVDILRSLGFRLVVWFHDAIRACGTDDEVSR